MQLVRGQRLKLADHTNISQDIQIRLRIEGNLQYDTCCISLDAEERLSDDRYMIFYNQTSSPEGAITCSDDYNSYFLQSAKKCISCRWLYFFLLSITI